MAYKQHFIEWFSGKSLPSYWSQENTAGTGTFAMVDAVDEGFSITTTSGTSNRNAITFNQVDQFAHDGSVFIAVARRVTSANAGLNLGFSQDDDFTIASGQSWAVINEDTATGTHKALQTRDGSSHSQTLSSVPIDTSWTNYKLTLSSDAKLYIDGSLEITKTTNLPTVKLQPAVRSISRAANISEIRIRYCEVYNT